MYGDVRDNMRTGDLLQWRSNSLLGTIIRARTRSNVNHTGMVIRMKEYEGLDRRVFTAESMENGVVLVLLSRRLADFDGSVYWLPLLDQYNLRRQAIGEAALERMGCPYDYASLFKQIVAKVSVEAERLFCSEFAFYCYGMAGVLAAGWENQKAPAPGDMPGLGIFGDPALIKE